MVGEYGLHTIVMFTRCVEAGKVHVYIYNVEIIAYIFSFGFCIIFCSGQVCSILAKKVARQYYFG